MTDRPKTRLTFKKIRFSLFLRSYAFYRISKELREKYLDKKVIPEVSRLSHVLNLPYRSLWRAIIQDKFGLLNKRIPDEDKIKIYLAIESELILLVVTKNNKSDFKDSDYEEEFALLSLAIERAAGDSLKEIKMI